MALWDESVPKHPIHRATRGIFERAMVGVTAEGANGVEIVAHCHPDGHVDLAYWEGCLHVRCAVCHALVLRIVVGEED